MKPLIKTLKDHRAEMLTVARGEAKVPADRPKMIVESENAYLAHVLSVENRKLLRHIIRDKPETIGDLARISGKTHPNVSRALGVLEGAGLIALDKIGQIRRPIALIRRVHVDIDLASGEDAIELEFTVA